MALEVEELQVAVMRHGHIAPIGVLHQLPELFGIGQGGPSFGLRGSATRRRWRSRTKETASPAQWLGRGGVAGPETRAHRDRLGVPQLVAIARPGDAEGEGMAGLGLGVEGNEASASELICLLKTR